jgi:hypothetical protein
MYVNEYGFNNNLTDDNRSLHGSINEGKEGNEGNEDDEDPPFSEIDNLTQNENKLGETDSIEHSSQIPVGTSPSGLTVFISLSL